MLNGMMAKANGKKGEIHIYGDIGGWFGDGMTTKSFQDEVAALGGLDELDLYINSGGGSIVDGLGIYNVLRRMKAKKTAYIDYLAASIASVIPMACDEIRIAGNGRVMIHRASGGAFGNVDEMRAAADTLLGFEEDIVKTYVARTKMDPEKIREMMHAETWMSAEEAKELGFVDAIEPLASVNKVESALMSRYNKVPEDLLTKGNKAANLMLARMNQRAQSFGASP